MAAIEIFVHGIPVPKGSMKAFGYIDGQGNPRGAITHDSAKTKPWQATVAAELRAALAPGWATTKAPTRMDLEFIMPRPAGHYRKDGTLLPSKIDAHHVVKPDRDKLLRAIQDAAREAGAYIDDSQVVDGRTQKRYTRHGELPGVRIWLEVIV